MKLSRVSGELGGQPGSQAPCLLLISYVDSAGLSHKFAWSDRLRVPQKDVCNRSSITFFVFGTLSLRPERPFTGVSGPSGPGIPKKSQKECFWGSAKKSPKIPEKVERYPKCPILGIFRLFQVFSGTFLQTPKNTLFETFLGFRARRARRLL